MSTACCTIFSRFFFWNLWQRLLTQPGVNLAQYRDKWHNTGTANLFLQKRSIMDWCWKVMWSVHTYSISIVSGTVFLCLNGSQLMAKLLQKMYQLPYGFFFLAIIHLSSILWIGDKCCDTTSLTYIHTNTTHYTHTIQMHYTHICSFIWSYNFLADANILIIYRRVHHPIYNVCLYYSHGMIACNIV